MKYSDKEIAQKIAKILSKIKEPITYVDIISIGMIKRIVVNQPYTKIYINNIYKTSRSPASMLISMHIIERLSEKIVDTLYKNGITQVEIIEEEVPINSGHK